VNQEQEEPPQHSSISIIDMMIEMKMNNRIEELKQHADKTWYVFSGSTPGGWDCSGLVMWFYSDFGVELEHSATKQLHFGEVTTKPIPGDIISFSRNGGQTAYHNGIYLGDGMYIHAPSPGFKTAITSIDTLPREHRIFTKILYHKDGILDNDIIVLRP
jgi:hypothetical protein